jgi:hypothetical protein
MNDAGDLLCVSRAPRLIRLTRVSSGRLLLRSPSDLLSSLLLSWIVCHVLSESP